MSASANKGTETATTQCLNEKKVETVDFRSSAGRDQEQKAVQVIHQPHPQPPAAASNTSGGVLTNAAASVASTLQSSKEAISGK
ncbi:uncharacterized protein LOC111401993 [Olea europaea var. sylvestris]|uniref:Uncharacterized protein n=1 Tax=Olea europaea subsp. europaea TaxID=158383 RepID=A0A8S0Q8R6_OLEEU|nr:uncharacterized protein LOC111401993 [Olea europaea var. sylvestris]CAA2964782.1 Hypothetical predicted protein [Olea europaea subsp. europaea]